MDRVRSLLQQFEAGDLSLDEVAVQLQGYVNLGHSRVDVAREERTGSSEVIYGQGKTAEQIVEISACLLQRGNNVLVTRVAAEAAQQVLAALPQFRYEALARLLWAQPVALRPAPGKIGVVCAGTSDLPVAEEARLTAEFYGNEVIAVYDAGVAGLHRLLDSLPAVRSCRVLIAVAGMEAALPSVLGGLVEAPVVCVPTSVGYGASFDGLAALLGMLNACSSGLSVVNIDNGFGAGFLANRINRL